MHRLFHLKPHPYIIANGGVEDKCPKHSLKACLKAIETDGVDGVMLSVTMTKACEQLGHVAHLFTNLLMDVGQQDCCCPRL